MVAEIHPASGHSSQFQKGKGIILGLALNCWLG
jgi:hypothetical protein